MLISERKLRKLIRSMIIESKRKKINENIIDDGSLEIDEFNEDYNDLPEEGGDDGYGDYMPIDDEFDMQDFDSYESDMYHDMQQDDMMYDDEGLDDDIMYDDQVTLPATGRTMESRKRSNKLIKTTNKKIQRKPITRK